VPEGPVFSSEEYLRASTGPFAPYFRNLIPDADSRAKLDPGRQVDAWTAERDRIAEHYGFNDDQRKKADTILLDRKKVAEEWYQAPENREKVRKYLDELAEVEAVERNPKALDYERENAWKDRRTVEAQRKDLVKEVDPWTATLRDALVKLATEDQVKAAKPYVPPMGQLEKLDLATMYGLSAIGLCLMLGLFTPLAALGGAAMLLNFYLSMPPFPGLPEGPKLEGHYRFVNKNLVEMFACLALASTPSGLWVGLDALLFGWIGRGARRREAEAARLAAEALAAEQARATGRPAPQDRRKFKSR